MRLLLDECIDERLRLLFSTHECQSARYAGLAGLNNGELLLAAEAAGFEAIITVDQSIPDQQSLRSRKLSVLVLCAPTNRLSDLKRLVPVALGRLDSIEPGQVVRIR
jgi:predicted nuclease of predicted toxin-antitoxin system